jgi:hypothetical protein
MSHEILVKTALKRQEAFRNLAKHLKTIKKTVNELDPEAEAYIFGSRLLRRNTATQAT